LTAEHILITSASANHRTAQHRIAKQTDDRKIALLGGMTPVSGSFDTYLCCNYDLNQAEMTCWWSHHAVRFKDFSATEKQRIEDHTGRIPLLLHFILQHNGGTLESWNLLSGTTEY
jgi:hypothetical protein